MQLIKQIFSFVFKIWASVSVAIFAILVMTIVSIGLLVMIGSGVSDEDISEERVVFGEEDAANSLYSIPINGVILGEKATSGWLEMLSESSVTYGYDIKKTLMDLADDDEVAGVILEINSPGGTIFGSQAIADGVAYYKDETGKPVIAYISNLAASGGYWVAASADEILADHGTTMGSIGVIFGPVSYYDGVISQDGGAFVGGIQTTGGIETEYISAGRSKDLGNPFRRMTADERSSLQSMVDDSYVEFAGFVADHRPLTEKEITDDLGALVYGEIQAKENGLIDQISNKQDAYDYLANKASVSDDYKIIRELSPDDVFSQLLGIAKIKTRTASLHPLCGQQSTALVYFGSVAVQCQP